MTDSCVVDEHADRQDGDHQDGPGLRIVFAGSPPAAVPGLLALAASRHRVLAVVTREDSPQGRRRLLTPTPVAAAADELGLRVIRTNRLAGEATDEILALRPDLGVIVAYGGLVRDPLLTAPPLGWINLHFSLLPRWRGAAPVQRAIMAGDRETGSSVFQLVPELDAGDVFATSARPIGRQETAGHLLDALAAEGGGLLTGVVDAIASGQAVARPQVGEVTLAPKLVLDDARIDWHADAEAVHDRIRGVSPEPGAFTILDGARLKVLEAAIAHDRSASPAGTFGLVDGAVLIGTGSMPIELITVQPAGKKPMRAVDWWRGRPAGSDPVAE